MTKRKADDSYSAESSSGVAENNAEAGPSLSKMQRKKATNSKKGKGKQKASNASDDAWPEYFRNVS